jgi:hypothetical protein
MTESARCAVCHRLLHAYVPRGGDGTLLYVYRHLDGRPITTNQQVHDYFEYAPHPWCPGSNRPGQEVLRGEEEKP